MIQERHHEKDSDYTFNVVTGFAFCAFDTTYSTSSSLYFRAEIPEDYGVIFPQDALLLDSLCFEIVGTDSDGDLIRSDGNVNAQIEHGMDIFSLDLLYYGNKAEDYSVILESSNFSEWNDGNSNPVPVEISFEGFVGEKGIVSTVQSADSSELYIFVPATGPRRGEKVGTINVKWEGPMDLEPGNYVLVVDLQLRSAE